MRRLILITSLSLLLPSWLSAQPSVWKSAAFLGVNFSPVNGDDLNAIMDANSLPQFSWSAVGLSAFGIAEKNKFCLLYAFDISAKPSNVGIYGVTTFDVEPFLGFGYSLIKKKRIELVPYLGPKYYFKGYWISCKGENTTFNQLTTASCRDYNFFSSQIAGSFGLQVLVKNKARKKNILSLSADYALVSNKTGFFRANAALDEKVDVVNPFSVRLGFRIG